jgi:hypothetical protein
MSKNLHHRMRCIIWCRRRTQWRSSCQRWRRMKDQRDMVWRMFLCLSEELFHTFKKRTLSSPKALERETSSSSPIQHFHHATSPEPLSPRHPFLLKISSEQSRIVEGIKGFNQLPKIPRWHFFIFLWKQIDKQARQHMSSSRKNIPGIPIVWF